MAQQEYKFMKAVILAGGLGKRLRPLTNNKPKPMMPLGGKPILVHVINWVKKNGIKEIVLCVSYLHKTIEDYCKNSKKVFKKLGRRIYNCWNAWAWRFIYSKRSFWNKACILYGE